MMHPLDRQARIDALATAGHDLVDALVDLLSEQPPLPAPVEPPTPVEPSPPDPAPKVPPVVTPEPEPEPEQPEPVERVVIDLAQLRATTPGADDYTLWRQAASRANDADRPVRVVAEPGRDYQIDRTVAHWRDDYADDVTFRGGDVEVDLRGATLHGPRGYILTPDSAPVAGHGSYTYGGPIVPLVFDRCTRVHLHDGSTDGHADTHRRLTKDGKPWGSPGQTPAQGYGHSHYSGPAFLGCDDVLIEDVQVLRHQMDGLFFRYAHHDGTDIANKNVTLRRVTARHNGRINVADSGIADLTIEDCDLRDAGDVFHGGDPLNSLNVEDENFRDAQDIKRVVVDVSGSQLGGGEYGLVWSAMRPGKGMIADRAITFADCTLDYSRVGRRTNRHGRQEGPGVRIMGTSSVHLDRCELVDACPTAFYGNGIESFDAAFRATQTLRFTRTTLRVSQAGARFFDDVSEDIAPPLHIEDCHLVYDASHDGWKPEGPFAWAAVYRTSKLARSVIKDSRIAFTKPGLNTSGFALDLRGFDIADDVTWATATRGIRVAVGPTTTIAPASRAQGEAAGIAFVKV